MTNKTIVRMKFGSHLYGTSTPASDVDYKSVYIPTGRDILLQRVQGTIKTGPDKAEGSKNSPGDVDEECFSLQHYLQLLAEGQTVAIDMLFAPQFDAHKGDYTWLAIYQNRERFLTKKSAAFVGYCRTQANKYGIKGSRVAAAKQAMEFFRDQVGIHGPTVKVGELPHRIVVSLCDNDHTQLVQGGTSERPEQFFECCNRKVSFGNTVKSAYEMFARIYENYGARARLADSNEGVDWKALSHAVRVGHEALELLNTGRVIFPLLSAKLLLAIKLGTVPYAQVARLIEALLVEVEDAATKSTLREEPDWAFIDNFVEDVYQQRVLEDARK